LATISFDSIESGRNTHPLEVDVQKECWKWLGTIVVNRDECLQDFSFMVPNGTQLAGARNRRAMYMASLKAQGFRPGVSDLVIAYPSYKPPAHCMGGDYPATGYHGAYIELKRDPGAYKGPKALTTALRPEQRDWLELMNDAGYYAVVAYGVDDFKRLVNSYLTGKSPRALDLFDWLDDTKRTK